MRPAAPPAYVPLTVNQKGSNMFKNVIVGVDGHEGPNDAVALARLLLGEGGRLSVPGRVPPLARLKRGLCGPRGGGCGGAAGAHA